MPVHRPHLLFSLIVMLVIMMSGPAAADIGDGTPSATSLTDMVQDASECADHGHAAPVRCCSPAHCLTALIAIPPNVPELYARLIVGRAADTELASRTPTCPDRPPKVQTRSISAMLRRHRRRF